jgi:glycyl-tRNA synthetase (class II)
MVSMDELVTLLIAGELYFSACEIYGVSLFLGFGPIGVEIPRRVMDIWWKFYGAGSLQCGLGSTRRSSRIT